MISSSFKKLIKAVFDQAGFDVIRRRDSPRRTLLGLPTRQIRTVIDVGANTGQFAKEISRFFPNAKVYPCLSHSVNSLSGPKHRKKGLSHAI